MYVLLIWVVEVELKEKPTWETEEDDTFHNIGSNIRKTNSKTLQRSFKGTETRSNSQIELMSVNGSLKMNSIWNSIVTFGLDEKKFQNP